MHAMHWSSTPCALQDVHRIGRSLSGLCPCGHHRLFMVHVFNLLSLAIFTYARAQPWFMNNVTISYEYLCDSQNPQVKRTAALYKSRHLGTNCIAKIDTYTVLKLLIFGRPSHVFCRPIPQLAECMTLWGPGWVWARVCVEHGVVACTWLLLQRSRSHLSGHVTHCLYACCALVQHTMCSAGFPLYS